MLKLTADSRYDIETIEKVYTDIVNRGVYIDYAACKQAILEAEDELENLEVQAAQLLELQYRWAPIDPKKPTQICPFFDQQGLQKHGKNNKTGITYPKEALERIAEHEPEHAEIAKLFIAIIDHKYHITKLAEIHRFCQPSTEYGEQVQVVYPSISQAVSNRISFTKPGLSNLGKRKRIVTAGPGYKLISLDYKAQEIWIVANMLNIAPMKAVLVSDREFYRGIAKVYTDTDLTDEQRGPFKTSALATLYQCTLGTALNNIPAELQETVRQYYKAFQEIPEIKEQRARLEEIRDSSQMISSYFGSETYCEYNRAWMNKDTWMREAFNRPIQSTGFDILCFALKNLERLYPTIDGDIHTYLTLHDEIVVRVEERLINDELIAKITDSVLLEVAGWTPCKLEVKVLNHWLDKED